MSDKVKVNGSWSTYSDIYVKVNGSWRSSSTTWIKVDGVWRTYGVTPTPEYEDVSPDAIFQNSITLIYISKSNLYITSGDTVCVDVSSAEYTQMKENNSETTVNIIINGTKSPTYDNGGDSLDDPASYTNNGGTDLSVSNPKVVAQAINDGSSFYFTYTGSSSVYCYYGSP